MKRIIPIFIIFSCLCLNTSAQEIDDKIDSFARLNHIDSFLVYSITCNDLGYSIDSCTQRPPLYLIWKKNGFYSIQKFETCKDNEFVQIDNENPLSFYFANRKTIDKEEIKPPVYYEYKKEKGRKYTVEVISTQSHSCFYNLYFRTNSNFIKKNVDSYNLDFIEFDNGKKSVNNKYNNSTKLNQLIRNLEALIKLTSLSKIN